jgi:hypothetical protein
MILLIIYIILFLIFLKINKDESSDKKPEENFNNLRDQVKNCPNCRCKYYKTKDNRPPEIFRSFNSKNALYIDFMNELEEQILVCESEECEELEDLQNLKDGAEDCEDEECSQSVLDSIEERLYLLGKLPGQKEYEESIANSEIIDDEYSANDGNPACEFCFPSGPGEPENAMSYNIICANPERLKACNCGIKGLCSPCQEDFDKAHIYALQNMCTNRGYIWKYASGASGRQRGYVWDCLHTKETCIKESIKVLKHPDNDPNYETVDKYFEWDNVAGACIMANPYIRHMCEGENRFLYDARGNVTGPNKCHITQDYCEKYGQDGFRDHDCFIYFGQKTAEALFNTIGVRCARINCDVEGCPDHHPPGFGKDDIDIRNPSYGKLNCDDNVKKANCSAQFMWDMYGPSRELVENASYLIPWNNEDSVCDGVPKVLNEEEKNRKCTL